MEADLSCREIGLMVVANILVNLDLRNGLVESMELYKGQILHY